MRRLLALLIAAICGLSNSNAASNTCASLFDHDSLRKTTVKPETSSTSEGIPKSVVPSRREVNRILKIFEESESSIPSEFLYQPKQAEFVLESVRKLDLLSLKSREYARQVVLKKYLAIQKGEEHPNPGGRKPMLLKKRNLELLLSIINRPHLRSLMESLNDRPRWNEESLIRLLDQYYLKTIGGASEESLRGHYSFAEVVELSKVLRKAFNPILGNSNFIQVYGSFPNGKSGFPGSDIDIHLDNQMSFYFLSYFSKPNSYSQIRNNLGEPQAAMASLIKSGFAQAEVDIAAFLGIKSYQQASLLTFMAESSENPRRFRIEIFGMYNPIVIKISGNKIFLQVYAGFESFPDKAHVEIDSLIRPEEFFETEIQLEP